MFVDATLPASAKRAAPINDLQPGTGRNRKEYLLAKQNREFLAQSTVPGVASGASNLLAASTERLKQWMIPDREIAELEQTGKVKRELEIDSPASGLITERNGAAQHVCSAGDETILGRGSYQRLGLRSGFSERHRSNQGRRPRRGHRGRLPWPHVSGAG